MEASPVTLEWWVGADDRWHRAASEAAVRQRRPGAAPAYETSMRIPSGDALQRVYAIGGAGDPIIVEIENASPVPVALALVVGAPRVGVDLGKALIELDHDLRFQATKPAAHAVAAVDPDALLAALERGDGAAAAPATVPADAGVVALVHPLAHRTRIRFALVLDPEDAPEIDLVGAPSAGDAELGWEAMLRRGMQVAFVDAGRQAATDQARADLLLEAATAGAGPVVFVALEDWGFDAEAVELWTRLGWRARRRAARRRFDAAADPGSHATKVLRSTRDALITEQPDATIVLAPEPPPPGEALEVHDAPTRAGSVSYALRWHGTRPALLWDVQSPCDSLRVVAPALDPEWSTEQPRGEVLLGEVSVNAVGG